MRPLAAAVTVALIFSGLTAAAHARDRHDQSIAVQAVNDALDRGEPAAAVRAWHAAYAAALRSGAWQPLLDLGDAALRIGRATRSSRPAIATARDLYRHAFFRARAEKSAAGMIAAANRFTSLGDRQVAAQCLAAVHTMAAR